jgi:hypothetical protein
VSLVLGDAVLGLGPIAKLPAVGEGPGFSRARLAGARGAGVEIVLEVEDVEASFDRFERSGHRVAEPIRTGHGAA